MGTSNRISKVELMDLLTASNKANFISLTYIVNESQSRTKQGKKLLQKQVSLVGTLNFKYEAKIQRLQEKQGDNADFVAQELRGKEYVGNSRTLLTDTKTQSKFYLRMAVENHTRPITTYFNGTKEISKDSAIELDLFAPSFFKPKTTAGRGTVTEENNFHFITPDLDRIESITINKVKYLHADFIDLR